MSPILKNSVHEMSPFENVHEKSPILKNSVHEMSLSTKCLHPTLAVSYQSFQMTYSLFQNSNVVPIKFINNGSNPDKNTIGGLLLSISVRVCYTNFDNQVVPVLDCIYSSI